MLVMDDYSNLRALLKYFNPDFCRLSWNYISDNSAHLRPCWTDLLPSEYSPPLWPWELVCEFRHWVSRHQKEMKPFMEHTHYAYPTL